MVASLLPGAAHAQEVSGAFQLIVKMFGLHDIATVDPATDLTVLGAGAAKTGTKAAILPQ